MDLNVTNFLFLKLLHHSFNWCLRKRFCAKSWVIRASREWTFSYLGSYFIIIAHLEPARKRRTLSYPCCTLCSRTVNLIQTFVNYCLVFSCALSLISCLTLKSLCSLILLAVFSTSLCSEKNRSSFCFLMLYCLQQVAPLEIHEENLSDVEEQLRFLVHVVEGAKIHFFLPLLKGSFSSWIWNTLGILVG